MCSYVSVCVCQCNQSSDTRRKVFVSLFHTMMKSIFVCGFMNSLPIFFRRIRTKFKNKYRKKCPWNFFFFKSFSLFQKRQKQIITFCYCVHFTKDNLKPCITAPGSRLLVGISPPPYSVPSGLPPPLPLFPTTLALQQSIDSVLHRSSMHIHHLDFFPHQSVSFHIMYFFFSLLWTIFLKISLSVKVCCLLVFISCFLLVLFFS